VCEQLHVCMRLYVYACMLREYVATWPRRIRPKCTCAANRKDTPRVIVETTNVCACVRACVRECVRVFVRACAPVCVYACMCVCVYVCM